MSGTRARRPRRSASSTAKQRPRTSHQEKLSARRSYALVLGVRKEGHELIAIDEKTKKVEYAHAARRVPEEQRWDAESFEWPQVVTWNAGTDDDEDDGEVPEFDFKKSVLNSSVLGV